MPLKTRAHLARVTTLQNAVLTAMYAEDRPLTFVDIPRLLEGSGYHKSHIMQSFDSLGRKKLIAYKEGRIWLPPAVRPTDTPLTWEH